MPGRSATDSARGDLLVSKGRAGEGPAARDVGQLARAPQALEADLGAQRGPPARKAPRRHQRDRKMRAGVAPAPTRLVLSEAPRHIVRRAGIERSISTT